MRLVHSTLYRQDVIPAVDADWCIVIDGGSMSGTTAQTITLDIQQRASHVAELETKLKEARLQSEKVIRMIVRLSAEELLLIFTSLI